MSNELSYESRLNPVDVEDRISWLRRGMNAIQRAETPRTTANDARCLAAWKAFRKEVEWFDARVESELNRPKPA